MKLAALILLTISALFAVACGSSDATPTPRGTSTTPPSFTPVMQAPTGNVSTPDFTLPLANGETIRLSDYRGSQAVAVVFYRGFF